MIASTPKTARRSCTWSTYAPQSEKTSKKYPFILNSGRLLYQYHSATMSRRNRPLNDFANASYLLMNESDAHKHGLHDGDAVRGASARGELAPDSITAPFKYSACRVDKI
ncbi:MAG: hypothetical protein GY799_05945 [Desulfobulbaceae bacterium]|nr:hypothetical protein [Desulfobulbaceae bacterium]